jgi:hypothetical protein
MDSQAVTLQTTIPAAGDPVYDSAFGHTEPVWMKRTLSFRPRWARKRNPDRTVPLEYSRPTDPNVD